MIAIRKILFMVSSKVFTACSYFKRVILYYFLLMHCFGEKRKVMASLKPSYPSHFMTIKNSFVSVNYILFVTGAKNLLRLRRAVTEILRSEKLGAFSPPPMQVAGKLCGAQVTHSTCI